MFQQPIYNRRGVNIECLKKYREFKENSECMSCGTKNELTFHHYDPRFKFMEVSKMVRLGYEWCDVLDEIDKCVMVCDPCHQEIHKRSKGFNKAGLNG